MDSTHLVTNATAEAKSGRLTYDVQTTDGVFVATIELRKDGCWYVIDNEDGLGYQVGGLNVSDANVLMSMDGRAQMVLNYHYSLQADLLRHTEPRPASSPDGTKVAWSSNMMNRGVPGDEGSSDMFMTIIRRPTPPSNFSAVAGNGDVWLSWERPLHSPTEIHWIGTPISSETRATYFCAASGKSSIVRALCRSPSHPG